MATRLNVSLDDVAAARLLAAAGGPRKQGEYLSRLILDGVPPPPVVAPDAPPDLLPTVARLADEVARLVAVLSAQQGKEGPAAT